MLYHSRLDGSLSIGYDSHGRAQRYTDSARGQLALTLDALARQTQETGPHGQSATSWDAASQRTRLSANFQSEAAQAISASWDAGGRLQTLTSPEGASQFTHDAAGRALRPARRRVPERGLHPQQGAAACGCGDG